MTPLTDAISTALIHSLWQDSMVAVLLWMTLTALGRRANARYAAGCAALALMAVLPALTATLIYVDGLRPDTISTGASRAGAIAENARATAAWFGGTFQPVASLTRLQSWALPVWSIGVLLFSLRLVGGGAHALALMRRSEDADVGVCSVVARLARRMGVEQPVRVAICDRTDGPATLGWLRPVILLPPATVLGLTPLQLEAVLAHELAHIRRHDYLVNVLQMVVETLLFYHPAAWWASRRIRVERELCCDDLAVESCGDALCYAQALTTIAKRRVTTMGLAVGATGGPLVQRIERLLGRKTTRAHGARWAVLLTLSLSIAIAMLNAAWIRAQVASDELVYSGLWEIRPSTTVGSVQLRLCYAELFSRSDMAVDNLGLTPARLAATDGPIRFSLRRDAGTLRFDGTIERGTIAGTYTFEPASAFSGELETRGFERPTSSLQHTLALHNLGLAVIDERRAQGIPDPDASLLVRQAQLHALLDDLRRRLDVAERRSGGWC
ncbi:MAG TPA: M56 family metallopeptidase [Vicinamibacterales bacterium]|nr:M56 family metallopeptidase [Vicinamibacterales bacterium]